MTFTVTAQPGNVPPRIVLSVTGVTGSGLTVVRNDPDGRARPVRAADPGTLTSGSWLGYDYEAPLAVPVSYSAYPTDGSATQVSDYATLTVDALWLIHPGIPDLSIRIDPFDVEKLESRSRSARGAIHQPLGRVTPIAVTEVRSSVTSGLSVMTDTAAQLDAMLAILSDGAALLLNVPPALGWRIDYQWISIADVDEGYRDNGITDSRRWTLPYTVVDRPGGGIQAQWTYADVPNAYASYVDVLNAFDTYADLLANTPN